jgi:hypothetical protein
MAQLLKKRLSDFQAGFILIKKKANYSQQFGVTKTGKYGSSISCDAPLT